MYTTAPDTFLGAHEQSARYYIDQGLIGKPVTVHAQVTNRYQPNTPFFDLAPRYFFFPLHYGGGFPFDLGGYYIHEMINLCFSVKRITGWRKSGQTGCIQPSTPFTVRRLKVNTPTTLLARWNLWRLGTSIPQILFAVKLCHWYRWRFLNWVTPICF